MKLIYLACPYSCDDPVIMSYRVAEATDKTAQRMVQGYNVFSPLTHSDPVADYLPPEIRWDHGFWLERDFQIIERADELHVLKLPGWDKSYGVAREIEFAQLLGKPVIYHEDA